MIRFSAALVVIAIGVLVGGIATSKLLLVYIAILMSAVALITLALGVALKRKELFGEESPRLAPAEGVGVPVSGGDHRGSQAAPDASGLSGFGQPAAEQPAGRVPSGSSGPDMFRADDPAHGWAAEPTAMWQAPAARDTRPSPDGPGKHQPGSRDSRPAAERDTHAAGGWSSPESGSGNGGWGRQNAPAAGDARAPLPGRHGRNAGDSQPAYPERTAPAASFTPATPPSRTSRPSPPTSRTSSPAAPWDERPRPSFQPKPAPGTPAPGTPAPGTVAPSGDASSSWFGHSGSASGTGEKDDAGSTLAGEGAASARISGTSRGDKGASTVGADGSGAAAKAAAHDTGISSDLDTAGSGDGIAVADEAGETSGEIFSDTGDTAPVGDGADEDAESAKSADSAASSGATVPAESGTSGDAGADETGQDGESEPESGETLVVVVPGVRRYHDSNCILIRFMPDEDVQKLTIPAAREAGCTPCAACHPEA